MENTKIAKKLVNVMAECSHIANLYVWNVKNK